MAVENAHFLTNEVEGRNIKIFGGSERPITGAPPAFLQMYTGNRDSAQLFQRRM